MGSFRTVSTRLQSISAKERKTLVRFQKRFGPDVDLKNAEKLKALRASWSAELRDIFSADQRKAIRKAVQRQTTKRPNGPGLRYLSLAEAKRRGVDLERLKAVQDRLYGQVARLLNDGGNSFSTGNITVRALDAPFDWPPMVLPPPPDVGTQYVPPFGEPWERETRNEASGDGRVTENLSYLDAEWGRIGSRLVARNHDAGDVDTIHVIRQNGFVVPFTVTTTGVLQVSVDLICLLCRHQIKTEDEWGWSQFYSGTASILVLSVFWNHDDGEPMSETYDTKFVEGLDCSGDGESSPGTVVQVVPGERRSVDLYTDAAFPAGKAVWVYVGTYDHVHAVLNDVSIDISLDSAWQVSSLTVLSL
jgi:hypothetical protein